MTRINPQLPQREVMYAALQNRDSRFEGIFFLAVKTTGIFCRPTCTAKKPKPENVEYFATVQQALNHGYRPCKLCRPLEPAGNTPAWIAEIIREIGNSPDGVLKDHELRARGVDPVRLRRWFKQHHGITFQAWLRALRINRAFGRIKHGDRVTSSAFDNGYGSLSGFNESFKKITGFAPSRSETGRVINLTRIVTPLGPMFAGATEQGICLLEFCDRRMLETQIKRLRRLLQAQFVPGENPHFELLERELYEYFHGRRREFTVALEMPGTAFQLQAWRALQAIPYGETRSYRQQAAAIGNPAAVRAVARANGDNRIALIIPCHRVIAGNGDLAGYGGGIWRKQYLLDLEREASAS